MIIYSNLRSSLPRALHQRRRLVCWFSSAFTLRPPVDRCVCVGALLAVAEGQCKNPRPAPWMRTRPPKIAREQPVPRWGNLTTVGRESATGTHATAESLTSAAVGVKPQDFAANQASISMLRR